MTAARHTQRTRTPPPRAAARPRTVRGRPAPATGRALWWKVALLVTLVLLGLPLAHALLGEVAALMGGAVLLGFLLGRWTAPGR